MQIHIYNSSIINLLMLRQQSHNLMMASSQYMTFNYKIQEKKFMFCIFVYILGKNLIHQNNFLMFLWPTEVCSITKVEQKCVECES